jgi:hypothetical protein
MSCSPEKCLAAFWTKMLFPSSGQKIGLSGKELVLHGPTGWFWYADSLNMCNWRWKE